MTRTEKRLITLANQRKNLIDRIVKAEREHKATQALRGRLVEATQQQIRTELRIERKKCASRETTPAVAGHRVPKTSAENANERAGDRA